MLWVLREVWAGALNHADLDALKQRNGLRQFAPLAPNEEDEGFYLKQ